ncbi:MAG: c-type cytochrome [Phycisphaerales bacterium JB043]
MRLMMMIGVAGVCLGVGGCASTGETQEVSTRGEGDRYVTALVAEFEATDEMIVSGQQLFDEGSCSKCHRPGGVGGDRAPSLADSAWAYSDGSLEGIRRTIALGVPKSHVGDEYPFEMYPMGKMSLNHNQLNALASYVWSLSR